MFGWVEPVTGLHGMMKWIKGNTDGFLKLLSQIVYKFKRKVIDLWVDRAKWHKGGRIEKFIAKHPQLHIHYLPAYHPELNYQEVLWRTMRYEETTNAFFEVIEDLGQIPDINIDQYMMKRVFANLIVNSLQAMENGGKLKVSTKKITGFVEVSFQDTGIGIPEEILERIFDPFFTTKAKGMGVGLTIVKKFVEKNGGTISVKSEKNKGSKFIVKLPI